MQCNFCGEEINPKEEKLLEDLAFCNNICVSEFLDLKIFNKKVTMQYKKVSAVWYWSDDEGKTWAISLLQDEEIPSDCVVE